MRSLLALIFAFTAIGVARAESLVVTSYNTGFLEKGGIDLVPCIKERLAPQVRAVLESATIAPRDKSFVILLQEVWTSTAFNAYRKAATAKGYFVAPSAYLDVKTNGQMIITNMEVIASRFEPFKSESYAGRGIRSVEVASPRGTLVVANVHTSFSDASGFLPAHREQFGEITRYFWPITTRASVIVGGDFNAGRNMNYHGATYDARSVIWDGAVTPAFDSLGMRVIGNPDAITWDEENNVLVNDPTRAIRIMNYFSHGFVGWDQTSSRLDQIFASVHLREIKTGRTMLQRFAPASSCRGHRDAQGRMHMSDHYGVFSEFDL